MARYDLFQNGTFSDPNNWINESTGHANNGAPGLDDTAVINSAGGNTASGSGAVGTLETDLSFLMNGLALTTTALESTSGIGIQLYNNASLTVEDAFEAAVANITVSSGSLTTNGTIQSFVLAGPTEPDTGGFEVDPGATWVANAPVDNVRVLTSGNFTAGQLSELIRLEIGGGVVSAGATSVQLDMVVQGATASLGAVTMLATAPAGLPQIDITGGADVSTGSIGYSPLITADTPGSIEIFGAGTTLSVEGDISGFPELDVQASASISISGSLSVNSGMIGGSQPSGPSTGVQIVGDMIIGQGSATPSATTFRVTANGSLDVGGTLAVGAEAGWNSTLLVNDDTSEVFGTVSVPGSITVATLNVGEAGAGTLDIEDGTVSATTATFASGNGTIALPGSLAATGTLSLLNGSSLQLQGGRVDAAALDLDATSSITGFGRIGNQGGNSTGQIIASGGTLGLTALLNAAGSYTIEDASTLNAGGGLSAQSIVIFDTGSAETLAAPSSQSDSAIISGFAPGDTIDVQGFTVTGLSYDPGSGRLSYMGSGGQTGTLDFNTAQLVANPQFQHVPSADGTAITVISGAPCFAAGTRIATARGEIAVEALRRDDRVILASGGTAALVWLGHRRIDCARHPRPRDVLPVRVLAHAFGPGMPHDDLLLSPDHAVFADGVLIPVRYLLNGRTVRQEAAGRIVYWHVELGGHAVLLAQGLPAESYLDTDNRRAFANAGSALADIDHRRNFR